VVVVVVAVVDENVHCGWAVIECHEPDMVFRLLFGFGPLLCFRFFGQLKMQKNCGRGSPESTPQPLKKKDIKYDLIRPRLLASVTGRYGQPVIKLQTLLDFTKNARIRTFVAWYLPLLHPL